MVTLSTLNQTLLNLVQIDKLDASKRSSLLLIRTMDIPIPIGSLMLINWIDIRVNSIKSYMPGKTRH